MECGFTVSRLHQTMHQTPLTFQNSDEPDLMTFQYAVSQALPSQCVGQMLS